jgi:hypothetical protein
MNGMDLKSRSRELIWGPVPIFAYREVQTTKNLSQLSRCPSQDSNFLSQYLPGRTEETHDKSHSESLIQIIQR